MYIFIYDICIHDIVSYHRNLYPPTLTPVLAQLPSIHPPLDPSGKCDPLFRLQGHTKEGYEYKPRYYDVTNPSTMTSLTPLLCRH